MSRHTTRITPLAHLAPVSPAFDVRRTATAVTRVNRENHNSLISQRGVPLFVTRTSNLLSYWLARGESKEKREKVWRRGIPRGLR